MAKLMHRSDLPAVVASEGQPHRAVASYECELAELRRTESRLRQIITQDEVRLRQKDKLIESQQLSTRESNHRLMNNLQLIASLLRLQSQGSPNVEVASQLAAASERIATVGRIHRRLNGFEREQAVAFKPFLDGLCKDLAMLLPAERVLSVEGPEIDLPTAIAIPLGFIVNELVMNAAKHGKGQITVALRARPAQGYALSVSNDGGVLPRGFDPDASSGTGMQIMQSFIKRIGGELRIDEGDEDRGPLFVVMFS